MARRRSDFGDAPILLIKVIINKKFKREQIKDLA